jgi:hypothetical protein
MSIEAMKQALEALETLNSGDNYKTHNAATALRQAIAEAEKQEPVAFRNTETGEFCTGWFLRKDLAKWQPLYAAPVHASDMLEKHVHESDKDRHKSYDPMERNVDYERGFIDGRADQMKSSVDKAVNRMAQREWVGLTDEDIYKVIEENIPPQLNTLFDMAKWVGGVIEAKLKEKNT